MNSPKKLFSIIGALGFFLFCFFLSDSEVFMSNVKLSISSKKYLSLRLAPEARLGNHIFELTTLYSLAQTLGRTPVVWNEGVKHQKMLTNTERVLPGLIRKILILNETMPEDVKVVEFHKKSRVYDDPKVLANITDTFLHLHGNYYQSWKYFPNRREELLGFMRSEGNLTGLPKSDPNSTITCIHTRRGDFKSNRFYMSDPDFIRESEQYLRDRESGGRSWKVVLFGDDQHFMHSVLENTTSVHYVSSNSPPDDFIYASRNCDNVLITAPGSTFGWWMGYFSKGNMVYFLDIRGLNDRVYKEGRMSLDDFFLPHWKMLSFENGTVTEKSNTTGERFS